MRNGIKAHVSRQSVPVPVYIVAPNNNRKHPPWALHSGGSKKSKKYNSRPSRPFFGVTSAFTTLPAAAEIPVHKPTRDQRTSIFMLLCYIWFAVRSSQGVERTVGHPAKMAAVGNLSWGFFGSHNYKSFLHWSCFTSLLGSFVHKVQYSDGT